ncbi:unnamed protein product, partial [Rotaria socialis]
GSYCVNFHDREHIENYKHPFPNPCRFTPYHCSLHEQFILEKNSRSLSDEINQHCLNFAHVCVFGRNCTDNDPLHWEKYIHVPRSLCSYGDRCKKLLEEDHLNSFTHPNIRDIRLLCKYADECCDRHKAKHLTKFRHIITLEDSGIVRYYNLNQNIDFVQNQKDTVERVRRYVQKEKWEPLLSESIPQEIINWIRAVRPVHRCRPELFESILLHGHVMSRDYMDQLKDPVFVATSVFQHRELHQIKYLKEKQCSKDAKEYIQALVIEEFEKAHPKDRTIADTTKLDKKSYEAYNSKSRNELIKNKEVLLSDILSKSEMQIVKTKAIEIAQASIKLHANPAGIGHPPDKELGTNRNVFTILGPHLGHYYGDVFIVFKREILHHPDANFSIQAATSYASGNCFKLRPWLGSPLASKEERIKFFHKSKLHAAIPGYEYATALELIALTSFESKKKSMNIDLATILKCWLARDAHQSIEAHLPQLIPLDYIDRIYMSQNIFDLLNSRTREFINTTFKHRIIKTSHVIELDHDGGTFGPKPNSKIRQEYQDFVLKHIMDKYDQLDINSISRPIQGTIITIPATDFNDPFVLPLTISQAYRQYKIDHPQISNDDTVYIYWQTMNGDMMLTLANEEINIGEQQPNLRCLTCYIAEKPATKDVHYHENVSYLHSGRPFQHEIVIEEQRYATASRSFFIGCNTDDFMTFCLEIQRSTGRVILSHSGPNSIYNHEQICATFSKFDFDLNQLNFVHVSSGAHTVPIRNLIVTFEKHSDLHPTSDSTFDRLSTSSAAPVLTTTKDTTDESVVVVNIHDTLDTKSPSFFSQVADTVGAVKDKFIGLFPGGAPTVLTPCSDGVNCLMQYSDRAAMHNSTYSHPCRFSELCRDHEPHLTHEPHKVPRCDSDRNCKDLCNPIHRAEYRHTGLPDFLIPCRNQEKCHHLTDQHRIRYSHGEHIVKPINKTHGKGSSSSS